MKNVVVLVASPSPKSVNRKLANTLEKLSEGKLKFDYPDLFALPYYDDHLWANPPAVITDLKRRVEAADAALIVTPEYNRSFPGVLKNALDWASRPYAQSSWMDKPTALVGATPGATGTAAGQGHLRSVLPVYGMLVMGQPEVYFNMKPGLITDELEITDETTFAFLNGWVQKFSAFIERHGVDKAEAIAAE
ncbi:chromate reductase [Devosia sp. YR412]|uniref:NADPH-dependent FMN reductase n=1 Tax=Devosia sp. YR412 TaxID=1881030 RepID=UPI0008B5AE43|nr:NAD(P)H-dependent oxidoreductase [Devosia sp. YR412]SEP99266.1 chromate reductase [Devosia sp. YR412]